MEKNNEQTTDSALAEKRSSVLQQLGQRLTRAAEPRGTLIVNPGGSVQRTTTIVKMAKPPQVDKPVYAADRLEADTALVADIPAMGYVWVAEHGEVPRSKEPPMVEDNALRNEFFEASINSTTGSLQSLRAYQTRGNRISQQLALRTPHRRTGHDDPDEGGTYSVMAADKMQINHNCQAMGEIETTGRLLDHEGTQLATFKQRYRVWRGSRVLRVEIELVPEHEPRADPWNAYYCSRFAWADETWKLYSAQNQFRHATRAKRLESPGYLELKGDQMQTTVFTCGLPYHRRVGFNKLDSILIPRGENRHHFTLGLGLDVTHPLQESAALLADPCVLEGVGAPEAGQETLHYHKYISS